MDNKISQLESASSNNQFKDSDAKEVTQNEKITGPFPIKLAYKRIINLYGVTAVLFGLGYIAYLNPQIFIIQGATLQIWNQAINAVILLIVPFLLGCLGAYARVLIAGELLSSYRKIILSSGILATFSWMGIKSKVFLALLSPYVEKASAKASESISQFTPENENAFYSMALVAVMVGMFSSNIFIFVNQRVKQLTNT